MGMVVLMRVKPIGKLRRFCIQSVLCAGGCAQILKEVWASEQG